MTLARRNDLERAAGPRCRPAWKQPPKEKEPAEESCLPGRWSRRGREGRSKETAPPPRTFDGKKRGPESQPTGRAALRLPGSRGRGRVRVPGNKGLGPPHAARAHLCSSACSSWASRGPEPPWPFYSSTVASPPLPVSPWGLHSAASLPRSPRPSPAVPAPPQSLLLLLPLPVDICLGKGTREVAPAWPPSTVSTLALQIPTPPPGHWLNQALDAALDAGVYKSGDEVDLGAKSAHLLWEGLLPSR